MIVESKHNQPKVRTKDKKKKKTTRRDKICIPHRKSKTKKLSITDHNLKPVHKKHTTHYLIIVKKTFLVLF